MASVGQDFANWQSIPGGNSSLGSFAAAYLAHKAGLLNLNDPSQMESIQKNGVGSTLASKLLIGSAPPKQVAPVAPSGQLQQPDMTGFQPGSDIQNAAPPVQGSMNNMGVDETMADNAISIDDTLPAFVSMIG